MTLEPSIALPEGYVPEMGDGRDINAENEEIPEWARPYIRTLKWQVHDLERQLLDATATSPEAIEVNRNIACMIYAANGARLAGSPTPQIALTVFFDAVVNARLGGLLLANNKGMVTINVVDIQAPLDDDPDDDKPVVKVPKLTPQMELPEDIGIETVNMVVNGEPAKVRRPRKNGTRADNNWPLHAFKLNDETPGLCGICHHREDDDLHAAHADNVQPHAFVPHAHDNQCDVCHLGEEMEIHNEGARLHVFMFGDGGEDACHICGKPIDDAIHEGALSPTAASLIASIEDEPDRREPATPEEALEQAQAVEALAKRGA